MRFAPWLAVLFALSASICRATAPVAAETEAVAPPDRNTRTPIHELIPWLLDEGRQLRGILFHDVILETTGKKVLPFDPNNEVDRRVGQQIREVLNQVMERMNAPDSPMQKIKRINEVSSHFEDLLRELLSKAPGLSCDFPKTSDGKTQRSGYPDLQITEQASKRVFYLDPKLFAAGGRDSTLRTFYFEPKKATNKVTADAVHFVAGFEHEARPEGGWKFTRWDLVDLSKFKVNLKAEFQGSNRDMYLPDAIVATSSPPVGRD